MKKENSEIFQCRNGYIMVYLFRWYSLWIRWGGGWGSGHPDPEIGGRGWFIKKIFLALWASVWSKISEGRAPRTPPLIRHCGSHFPPGVTPGICSSVSSVRDKNCRFLGLDCPLSVGNTQRGIHPPEGTTSNSVLLVSSLRSKRSQSRYKRLLRWLASLTFQWHSVFIPTVN